MAIPRIGGAGVPLDLGTNAGYWSRVVQGGAGYPWNGLTLPSGAGLVLPPGVFDLLLGPISYFQVKDPITGVWRTESAAGFARFAMGDGANMRIANLAGTVASVTVGTPGSGYNPASPPSVTPSTGNSVLQAIVGGAVSVAVTSGGAGYTQNYPPILIFSAPPLGGIQATGHATVSAGGVITGVVMDNIGAGYTLPPNLLVVLDPRVPPPTTSAVLTVSLTGAGQITGVQVVDGGFGVGTAPTLTFGSGAAAATANLVTGTAGFDQEVVQPL